MGYQVIRQPDGMLAIWSSYCDEWAAVGGTADEVAEWFAERAAVSARDSAGRIARQVLAGKAASVYCQFALSFEEADARAPHGRKAADL